MEKLLQEFSLTQILTFIVLAAAAIKGIITFFDWTKDKMKEKVHQDERPENLAQQINNIELIHHKDIETLKQRDIELQTQLTKLTEKIDLLIKSDKDNIKAWITEQYYKFTDQGNIDNYSLDCIEHRYEHYAQEGGNSFVETLMKEIRALPKK